MQKRVRWITLLLCTEPISPPGNHAALSSVPAVYDVSVPDLIQDNSLLGGDMATVSD